MSSRRFAIAFLSAIFLSQLSTMEAQTVASPSSAADPQTTSGASVAASKDADGYVLRMNVKLVNVFTNVTDSTGAIVGGLTKDDFAISEDGRPQRIAVFERQSELPLSLVLAIDTSGSVHKDLPLEQDAAHKFVHALLRGQDQISLLEFATDVRQVVPFTNQPNRIDRGLAGLRGGPATALYDAIYLASENLAKQSAGGKPGRKVLVLVSDGGDTANTVTYAEALEKALRGEVMVYSIIDVPIEASAGRDTGGEHALITMAEQTGGKYFYANAGGLDKAFAQVSEDLRTQYLLGYYPAHQAPGQNFHRIHVTVPRAEEKAFDIRYRTGYYADAQSGN
jgi:Ca-activated chloride channel homolog